MAAWMPLLLGIVVAVAYANALDVGFHFDDWHVVQQNPAIRTPANLARFFFDPDTSTALPENRTLRPLLMASFALNYAISGTEPWSYHLTNIALHWLVVLLVFRIVRRRFWLGASAVPIAAGAALIVAAHPLNSSAIDHVSARSAILATLCYLAAFDAAIQRRCLRATLLLGASLLTKEIGFTLPFVVLGYWLIERSRPDARLLASLVLVVVASVAWRVLLLPPAVFTTMHGGLTPWQYCMTGWSAYLYYLRLFAWPDSLVVDRLDYPLARSITDVQAWGSLAALCALGVLAFGVRARTPALTFAAVWFFVTLAAESTLFPLAEAVNEHRPYLAMLGLGTVASIALWTAAGRLANTLRVPAGSTYATALASVVTILGCATVLRNEVWRSDYDLWIDATRKAPASTRAWTNAGRAAMAIDRLDEARSLLNEGHRLAPCYAYALLNLSALERREGHLADALTRADEAVACSPGFALAHQYRAAALAALGRDDEALAAWRQVTELDPRHVEAWAEQARAFEQREAWADAARAWGRVVEIDVSRLDAAMSAGVIDHYRLGRSALALAHFERVLATSPSHYGAQYQRAVALLALGRTNEAFEAWSGFAARAQAIDDRTSLDLAPEPFRLASQSVRRR